MIHALFPLAFQYILDTNEQAARAADDKTNIYAYQYDADLVCTAASRAPAKAAFVGSCAAAGLRPNCSKETIYYGPDGDRNIIVAIASNSCPTMKIPMLRAVSSVF